MRRRWTLLMAAFVAVLLSLPASAQTGSIKAKVMDSKTKEALPSATVILLESSKAKSGASNGRSTLGRVANKNGMVEFNEVPVGSYVVRVTYLSYATLEKPVMVIKGEMATLELGLTPDVKGLSEVVVTGVASRTEKSVSEVAVARVDAAALTESNSYQDVSQLLTGKVAGVRMSTTAGSAGNGFRFDVRSGGGLNGSGQPIVFLDGVRLNQSYFDAGVGGQEGNALSILDPESIESVEVLKGPAASALYGTVGANGVVLIKTKHGSRKAAPGSYALDIKTTVGVNEQQRPYTEGMMRSYMDANRVFPDNLFGSSDTRKKERGLADSVPTRYAMINATNISFGGSNPLCNYFIGYDKRDEQGLLVTNRFQREAVRANFSAFPSEKLTLNFSTGFTFSNTTIPISDNSIIGLLGATTINAPKVERGLGVGSYAQVDSMAVVSIQNIQRERRFVGSLEALYAPTNELSFRALVGYDGRQFRYDQYFPYNMDYKNINIVNGSRYTQQNGADRINFDLSAAYTWKIDADMRLMSTVGIQGNTETDRSISFQKDSLPSTLIVDAGSGSKFISAGEGFFDSRQAGVFLQEEFSYQDAYFASVGLRNDYASAIGVNAPSIFYPRASGAVRLDNVTELPSSINLLKARVAYGESGSLPGLLDGSLLRWGNQNSGEGPGAVISFLGNPGIQPERIKELEMGFEVEFDNAYGMELTYFMQTATNSIFNVVLPPSVGVPSVRKNVGAISGSGIETNLYARLFRTADYQLDLNFIWNYANNVVDDLGDAPPIISEPNVVFVGQPRAAFYTNPVRGALYDSLGKYLKPDVDTSMRKFFGNPVAPNNGSFSVNFRFLKDFTLNLLTDWTIGGTLFNRSKQFLASFGNSVEYNRLHNALGIPNKPGSFIPIDTSVQRLTPGTPEYTAAADRYAQMDPNQFGAPAYFESSDFFRIRELSLRWDGSSTISELAPGVLRSFSLTVGARNLALFSSYSFPDPEVNSGGSRVTVSRGRDFITLQNPRVLYATIAIGF